MRNHWHRAAPQDEAIGAGEVEFHASEAVAHVVEDRRVHREIDKRAALVEKGVDTLPRCRGARIARRTYPGIAAASAVAQPRDALLAFHARLLVEAFEQRPRLVARQEIAMDTVAEGIEIALSLINIVRGLGKIVA